MKDWNKNMTKEEQLREEQEELFFKKMFAAFDKTDDPKYEALNEQLKNDPAYQTTEEEDKAMLDFIAREIARRDEERTKENHINEVSTKESKKKTGRSRTGFFRTAAVIAAILMFVTVTAWAEIPNFRTMALNLLLKVSGEATRVEITDSTERSDREEVLEENNIVLLGYRFPGVPEGLIKEDQLIDHNRAWIRYTNEQEKSIKYQVFCGIERDVVHDTEEANSKKIYVNGHAGMLTIKGKTISISWFDKENKVYFLIITNGFDSPFTYSLAKDVAKVH